MSTIRTDVLLSRPPCTGALVVVGFVFDAPPPIADQLAPSHRARSGWPTTFKTLADSWDEDTRNSLVGNVGRRGTDRNHLTTLFTLVFALHGSMAEKKPCAFLFVQWYTTCPRQEDQALSIDAWSVGLLDFPTTVPVSYTHLTLPTNREV